MEIRKASQQDWQEILAIYQRAREYMRQTGNPNQWKDSSPSPLVLANDIASENLYVVAEGPCIHGVFALIFGSDPTYKHIDGTWLNDDPYAAIHRVASAGKKKGILEICLRFCRSQYTNLRIDTHHDNLIMQHLLDKHGFVRCGTIYLANGDPRIAYQYIRKDS